MVEAPLFRRERAGRIRMHRVSFDAKPMRAQPFYGEPGSRYAWLATSVTQLDGK
jgi:hypothetical protein